METVEHLTLILLSKYQSSRQEMERLHTVCDAVQRALSITAVQDISLDTKIFDHWRNQMDCISACSDSNNE